MPETSPQISRLVVRIAWLMQLPRFTSGPIRYRKAIETSLLWERCQCECIDFAGAVASFGVGILINRPIPESVRLFME